MCVRGDGEGGEGVCVCVEAWILLKACLLFQAVDWCVCVCMGVVWHHGGVGVGLLAKRMCHIHVAPTNQGQLEPRPTSSPCEEMQIMAHATDRKACWENAYIHVRVRAAGGLAGVGWVGGGRARAHTHAYGHTLTCTSTNSSFPLQILTQSFGEVLVTPMGKMLLFGFLAIHDVHG